MTFPRLTAAQVSIFIVVACAIFSSPSRADSEKTFGNFVVHYNAISTSQLLPAIARQYGIERSPKKGLLNISVEQKATTAHTVNADISATVGDLTGHDRPVRMRETTEDGDIDYLGEFELDGSATYVFNLKVATPGQAPFVVKFTQDFVID